MHVIRISEVVMVSMLIRSSESARAVSITALIAPFYPILGGYQPLVTADDPRHHR